MQEVEEEREEEGEEEGEVEKAATYARRTSTSSLKDNPIQASTTDILQKIVRFVYTGSVEVEDGADEDDFIDGLDMLLRMMRELPDALRLRLKGQLNPGTRTACLPLPRMWTPDTRGSRRGRRIGPGHSRRTLTST